MSSADVRHAQTVLTRTNSPLGCSARAELRVAHACRAQTLQGKLQERESHEVSLKWLNEYVEVPTDTKALCDKLDLTGTGVEGVEVLGATFDGVVVGYVETCEPHPDSDHMHVVTVNTGTGEPVQIVCGAPNIKAGIKLPVATVGGLCYPRRFQDQEVEAARCCECRHVLLAT